MLSRQASGIKLTASNPRLSPIEDPNSINVTIKVEDIEHNEYNIVQNIQEMSDLAMQNSFKGRRRNRLNKSRASSVY